MWDTYFQMDSFSCCRFSSHCNFYCRRVFATYTVTLRQNQTNVIYVLFHHYVTIETRSVARYLQGLKVADKKMSLYSSSHWLMLLRHVMLASKAGIPNVPKWHAFRLIENIPLCNSYLLTTILVQLTVARN